jgi:putative membrane protein
MMDWGYGWGGGLFMILFWIAVIVGIVLLVRWLSAVRPAGTGGAPPEKPLDVLKRRYAAGEIDKKEFEEKRKDLQE